jgi:DNA modification methylase
MSDVRIYNQCCLEAMSQMKDKEYDLAICDPPYFSGPDKLGYFGAEYTKTKVKRQNYKILGDWTVPTQSYFNELLRVSKNQIIWGFNYFKIMNLGTGRIIWDKKNDESMFSKCEIAYNSTREHVSIFRFAWNGFIQENMKNKELRTHPTQKPVALYQWLLKNYAKQGDRILDTHGGSCSSAIACDIMGFSADIFEIDKDYYEAALDRFNRHKQQQVMNF